MCSESNLFLGDEIKLIMEKFTDKYLLNEQYKGLLRILFFSSKYWGCHF